MVNPPFLSLILCQMLPETHHLCITCMPGGSTWQPGTYFDPSDRGALEHGQWQSGTVEQVHSTVPAGTPVAHLGGGFFLSHSTLLTLLSKNHRLGQGSRLLTTHRSPAPWSKTFTKSSQRWTLGKFTTAVLILCPGIRLWQFPSYY